MEAAEAQRSHSSSRVPTEQPQHFQPVPSSVSGPVRCWGSLADGPGPAKEQAIWQDLPSAGPSQGSEAGWISVAHHPSRQKGGGQQHSQPSVPQAAGAAAAAKQPPLSARPQPPLLEVPSPGSPACLPASSPASPLSLPCLSFEPRSCWRALGCHLLDPDLGGPAGAPGIAVLIHTAQSEPQPSQGRSQPQGEHEPLQLCGGVHALQIPSLRLQGRRRLAAVPLRCLMAGW